MATLPATKVLTYQEYLRTPEMMKRYDIIDGVMEFMTPPPTIKHQLCLGNMLVVLSKAVKDSGELLPAPFDIIISRKPLRTRQPDLLFVRRERRYVLKDQMDEGPDMVVEIVSSSNPRKAVLEKLGDYARIGVQECWMVSTENRNLEVWRNHQGHFRPAASFRVGQKVRSQVFPAFRLPASVFP